MISRFEGDPKIILDENGADLVFKGGQPVMDAGLENAVVISLFTAKDWAGNTFFKDPNQQLGSDFEEKANQSITVSSLNDTRNAAEKALQWMVDSGIASRISVIVKNPRSNWLDIGIVVEPPGKDKFILIISRKSLNWVYQKIDPAYLKV